MNRHIIFFFLFTSLMLAQNKIDSLFLFSHGDYSNKILLSPLLLQNDTLEKLPLQYFLIQAKMNSLNDKLQTTNKILYTEMTENYKFSDDELNSGLSADELISYLKNKKMTMKILADDYYNHTDVNWSKIEKILGISRRTFAFILAFITLVK
jgi:hypothetical protein